MESRFHNLLSFQITIPLILVILIATARPLLAQTEKAPGWLGVMIGEVTKKAADDNKMKDRDGALVTGVEKESPAEKAGIRKDDIIVEFDGRKIFDADDLRKSVRRFEPGKQTKVGVIRSGDRRDIQVTLGSAPESTASPRIAIARPIERLGVFLSKNQIMGMKLLEVSAQFAEQLGAPVTPAVIVDEVEKGSVAEKAGFKAGDVITRFGGKTVDEMNDVRRAYLFYDEGETFDVDLLRKGKKISLKITRAEDDLSSFDIGPMTVPHPDISLPFQRGVEEFQIEIQKMKPELERLKKETERTIRIYKEKKSGEEV